MERDRLEAMVAALKEVRLKRFERLFAWTNDCVPSCQKLTRSEQERDMLEEENDQQKQNEAAHRERQEALAQHIEQVVAEMRNERESRQKAERELDAQANEYDAALRSERRALEAKESTLASTLADLARTQALLNQRESDLAEVQSVLRSQEAEARKLGESATTDRFSLQLEVDRYRRDAERLEEELSRARAELSARETKTRERDDIVDRLHTENRDLMSKLTAQTQAHLNATEKLDAALQSLRDTEKDLAACKQRLNDVELKLSKDQRSSLHQEKQLNEQLQERNTLLLTIYSYMDRILGVEKAPVGGALDLHSQRSDSHSQKKPETRPYTNFSVFHDLLMSRLKTLNQLATNFESRSKEIETRFTDKLAEIRKQFENRWRTMEKFEATLKSTSENRASWRRKFALKEGELDALRSTNAELSSQISAMRRPGQGENAELKAAQARATNAERRYQNAMNQLATQEETNAAIKQKASIAEGKWEARVKEYEARIRASEERTKRERQGGKERAAELENQVKFVFLYLYQRSMK